MAEILTLLRIAEDSSGHEDSRQKAFLQLGLLLERRWTAANPGLYESLIDPAFFPISVSAADEDVVVEGMGRTVNRHLEQSSEITSAALSVLSSTRNAKALRTVAVLVHDQGDSLTPAALRCAVAALSSFAFAVDEPGFAKLFSEFDIINVLGHLIPAADVDLQERLSTIKMLIDDFDE